MSRTALRVTRAARRQRLLYPKPQNQDTRMPKRRNAGVLFQPGAGLALQRGAAQMIAAVRPTLGPRPRYTAVERATSGGPELLDQGATIGRRVLALPDRNEDVGAMLARHLMWRMEERVGDGSVTAAVLFQAIFEAGRTYAAAGGNAMALRHHLQAAERVALTELDTMTVKVEGKEMLSRLAMAVCFDAELAKVMGEIFDIIGEYGGLDIRKGRGRDLEREYVEGMYWDGALLSRELGTDIAKLRAELEDAAVLVSNLEINDTGDLTEFLARCVEAGIKTLFIVARHIGTDPMGLLTLNNNAGKLKIAAARMTMSIDAARDDMQDLAILTGARPVRHDTGDMVRSVRVEDLGKARRIWADKDYLGVAGGGGDPRRVRQHLAELRAAYERSQGDARTALRRRIGKLLGGSATLWIGAATEAAMETRKTLADRTAESLRAALIEGALPGGGSALLACRPALRECARQADSPDARAAYRILTAALEAPMRTIVANAGGDIAAAMAGVDRAPRGYGYDVESGRVCDMASAGVLDVASVTRLALSSAVSAAAMALTTDALVHTDFGKQAASYTP
jgi:chaperonin GroEL